MATDDTPPTQLPPINAAPADSAAQQTGVSLDTDGYDTPWKAALAALSQYNPQSILSDNEYGGLIYKKNSRFFFTEAVVGEKKGHVSVWEALTKVPADCRRRVVGDYHTHAAGNPNEPDRYEQFSGSPLERIDPAQQAHFCKNLSLTKDECDAVVSTQAGTGDRVGAQKDTQALTPDEAAQAAAASPTVDDTEAANASSQTKKAPYILDVSTYTCFLGTPQGRFGIYSPSADREFYMSPDPRLLPSGQQPPAAGYAH